MVDSNSLSAIREFPLNREIRRALPSIIEIVAINDSLLVYNENTDEPIEVTFAPDDSNQTLFELREALIASGKFAEVKIEKFIDSFARSWLKLETGYMDVKKCFAKAKRLKRLRRVNKDLRDFMGVAA